MVIVTLVNENEDDDENDNEDVNDSGSKSRTAKRVVLIVFIEFYLLRFLLKWFTA